MNRWILDRPVSIVLSISCFVNLDNPITSTSFPTSSKILLVASNSPSDAAGNPASITSTPSLASCLAILTF